MYAMHRDRDRDTVVITYRGQEFGTVTANYRGWVIAERIAVQHVAYLNLPPRPSR